MRPRRAKPSGIGLADIKLGLHANWRQFSLLLLINAFVGAMIGLERVTVPLLAEQEFGLVAASVATSFIVSFGLTKAVTNLLVGRLADQVGRRRLLILGWLFGLPVPLMIIFAPSWWWVVAANVLLGLNQGLCWSTTVIMKIDLVGPHRRGLAMGLNEFAGYGAVGGAALLGGWLAGTFGLRPVPFIAGIAFAILGLLLSLVFVQETRGHVEHEARLRGEEQTDTAIPFRTVVARVSWRERRLFGVSQAGFVNNLNDGLAWGLLPLFFAAHGLSVAQIGVLAAVYPAVWAVGQVITGAASDRLGRKPLIVGGMWLQALALVLFALLAGMPAWTLAAVLLGAGTAMVYPTLLAAVGDASAPTWRAAAVGVYRLWRDAGYAAGALLVGMVADALGLAPAIEVVALLTFLSGIIVAVTMPSWRSGIKPH